jgi:tight adherence protein B
VRRVRRRLRILVGGLALAVALPSAAAAGVTIRGVDASSYPTNRVTIVTSTPSKRAPQLTENGKPVVAPQVRNLAHGKTVALLIDNSRSMAGKPLRDAAAAAQTFVDSKPRSDRVGIDVFGHTALALTGFSSATIDTAAALQTLSVDRHQGTALYDAVVLAAGQLEAASDGSRVIILLTDGGDRSSEASLQQAIKAARDAGVAIYAIGIEGRTFSPTALEMLARETGGSYHRAMSTATLPTVYAEVARELARTWRVAYVTTARPGDKLQLAATVPGSGSATTTFSLPGSDSAISGGPLPAFLTSSFLSTIAFGLLIGLLVLGAGFTVMAGREGAWLRARLEAHIGERASQQTRRGKGNRLAAVRQLAQGADESFAHMKQWRALRRLLERADLPLRPAEFVFLSAGCGLGLGLLAALSAVGPVAILAGMAIGGSLPLAFAWFRASQRLKQFENQLPDLLITIAASLKAGHSFRQGLQSVVEEGQPPASTEFKRVLTETRLGRPMDDALIEMGERVGSKNLDFVITAVTIQRQVGGSLAGLFDMVADAVRQRQQFQRKIKGLTAMGRMSAYVLIGLPFFVAGMLTLINPTYMSPLYHTSTGHKLMIVGVLMMLFGSAVLKKIVSFKG